MRLLLALLTASLLPLIVNEWLVVRLQENVLNQEAADQEQQTMLLVGSQLEHHLEDVSAVARLLARRIGVSSLDEESGRQFLNEWGADYEHFENLQVYTVDGRLAYESQSSESANGDRERRLDTALFLESEQQLRTMFMPGLESYHIHLFTPVLSQSDEVLGMLVAVLPIEEIENRIVLDHTPLTGALMILDMQGVVLQVWYDELSQFQVGDQVDDSIIDWATSPSTNHQPMSPMLADDGNEYVVSTALVPSIDWILVSYSLEGAAGQGLHTVTTSMALLSFALTFILSLTIVLLLRRFLTAQLETLVDAAEGMFTGYHVVPLPDPETQDRELARLTKAFSRMRDSVVEREKLMFEMSIELETNVLERTTELRAVNEQLEETLADQKRISEELREARDIAEQASRAKGSFLANMSHELRTPLSSIIGYSELLRDQEKGKPAELFLEKILNAGTHVLGIVNDILNLAKIEAGYRDVLLVPFVVSTMVEDVVDMSRPLWDANKNEFQVVLEDRIGVIISDEMKIRQILLNLLSNAAKFTKEGLITLRVYKEVANAGHSNEVSMICFAVTDTGIGMNQEQIDRLFQPFTQVHDPNQYFGGTGLGLSLSKRFSEVLNGDLTVQSAEREGTTFFLRLPLPEN